MAATNSPDPIVSEDHEDRNQIKGQIDDTKKKDKQLVKDLKVDVLRQLAMHLNPRTELGNDWTGMAGCLGYKYLAIQNHERKKNPTLSVLSEWCRQKGDKTVTKLISVLKEIDHNLAAQLLEPHEFCDAADSLPGKGKDLPKASVEASKGIWWDVQKPVASFTGRAAELKLLHENVINGGASRQTLISENISAVTGLGGIGKSELARMYALQKGTSDFDGKVAWINAEDHSSMTSSFCGLAEYLGMEIKDRSGQLQSISSIVARVYDKFTTGKSLFIFDNAETLAVTRKFLPKQNPAYAAPYVLLTSRSQDWGDNILKVQLDMLSQEEAVQLITQFLTGSVQFEVTEEDSLLLAEKLHCFPLALQQAVAYIKKFNRRRKFTIRDYLDAFDKKTKEVLDFQVPNNEYTKTVFVTWQVTFDKLHSEGTNKLALDILGMIAYLHADAFPFSIFMKVADNDEDDLWDAFEILEQYSLIKKTDLHSADETVKEAMYSTHRLVQTVLRIQLHPNIENTYLSKALTHMDEVIQEEVGFGNSRSDRRFLLHAKLVWDYGRRDEELLSKFAYLPVRICDASFCLKGFRIYRFKSSLLVTLDYVKEQYSFMKEKLGSDHHATLALEFDIARTLHHLGKHQDALIAYKEVIERNQQVLGVLHCDTLAAQMELGFLYMDLKKPKMSLKIFKDVYENKKKAEELPRDTVELYTFRDICTALYGIVENLKVLQRYEEAKPYEKILKEKREVSFLTDRPRILYF